MLNRPATKNGAWQHMQLSQLTIAVLAGSDQARQWLLLSAYRPVIFGAGMVAGATAVAITRGWLRWRRTGQPARTGEPAAAAAAQSAITWPPPAQPDKRVDRISYRPAEGRAAPAMPLEPVACAAPDEPRPEPATSLRIGVLGQLTINGEPGALLPAQTQLLVALALHGENGLHNKQLCRLLGSDSDHRKPTDSLRQLIVRTRRQLGRAADGREWIAHLGGGRYALHKQARLDWHEFEALTDQGIEAGDAGLLAAALKMIRGEPFSGCYYWWLDIELVEAVESKIVAAASALAELALCANDPAGAARAARVALAVDPASEQLWRLLMRAEHIAGNLAGVREAWSRCVEAVGEVAADGQPERATTSLYRQLLDR